MQKKLSTPLLCPFVVEADDDVVSVRARPFHGVGSFRMTPDPQREAPRCGSVVRHPQQTQPGHLGDSGILSREHPTLGDYGYWYGPRYGQYIFTDGARRKTRQRLVRVSSSTTWPLTQAIADGHVEHSTGSVNGGTSRQFFKAPCRNLHSSARQISTIRH